MKILQGFPLFIVALILACWRVHDEYSIFLQWSYMTPIGPDLSWSRLAADAFQVPMQSQRSWSAVAPALYRYLDGSASVPGRKLYERVALKPAAAHAISSTSATPAI
jgi:hypothetical protein